MQNLSVIERHVFCIVYAIMHVVYNTQKNIVEPHCKNHYIACFAFVGSSDGIMLSK